MNVSDTAWTPREKALLALCIAALGISLAGYFDLGGSAGGAPRGGGGVGSSVTSGEIRNGTIRGRDIGATITSADIVDGSIRASDLGIYRNEDGFGTFVGTTFPAETHLSISCDPGDVVISGGYRNSNSQSVAISQFYPDFHPFNRWNLTGQKFGQGPGGFVNPIALCLND